MGSAPGADLKFDGENGKLGRTNLFLLNGPGLCYEHIANSCCSNHLYTLRMSWFEFCSCLNTPTVALEHAKLEFQWGRLFCTALLGEEGEKDTASFTWIDGVQILTGIRYLVAPGSRITFGNEDSSIRVDFEEEGGPALMLKDMILAWTAVFCKESRKEVENFFDES